ncbi:MAG TPA: HD domain-containing protein [Stellaceae bacterium]
MAETHGLPAGPRALSRLERQLSFITEIDKLKQVLRHTSLLDGSRRENDAEHCWHLSLMAVVLMEHAAGEIDIRRVLTMLLIHDIVEIDTGDALLYDETDATARAACERQAAERIFGMLPPDQAHALRALWNEFEARESADAKFARALDRLQPLLQNHRNEGGTWRQFGITAEQVLARKNIIADGSPVLCDLAMRLIEDSVRRGYLAASPTESTP